MNSTQSSSNTLKHFARVPFNNQELLWFVIISFILVTLMFDSGMILYGEIRCWSRREVKGSGPHCPSGSRSNYIDIIFLHYSVCNLPKWTWKFPTICKIQKKRLLYCIRSYSIFIGYSYIFKTDTRSAKSKRFHPRIHSESMNWAKSKVKSIDNNSSIIDSSQLWRVFLRPLSAHCDFFPRKRLWH